MKYSSGSRHHPQTGGGRLIRDIDDRGVLVICDNRLVMRPYGAVFLASLRRAPRTRDIRRAVRFSPCRRQGNPH